jgi:hypothetical protein
MISAKLKEAFEHGRRKPKPPANSTLPKCGMPKASADSSAQLPILPEEVSDPDDVIDPDDIAVGTSLPSRSEITENPTFSAEDSTVRQAPPAQPRSWWTAIVMGRQDDAVRPQDALLAATRRRMENRSRTTFN